MKTTKSQSTAKKVTVTLTPQNMTKVQKKVTVTFFPTLESPLKSC